MATIVEVCPMHINEGVAVAVAVAVLTVIVTHDEAVQELASVTVTQ